METFSINDGVRRIGDDPFLLGAFNAVSQHVRDNRVQAGFSYKFDMFAPPAPIMSKY